MFECGLEGITIKIVKKNQYEQQTDGGVRNENGIASSDRSCEDVGGKELPQQQPQQPQNQDQKPVTPKMTERTSKPEDKTEDASKDSENISSCVIELKVVWFNFAAPPRAPITRKIDYTR